jgi:hypothetical protein
MTVDPELRALIDHASEFVERAFKHQGVVHPMWIADTTDGRRLVVPPPVPFRDAGYKDLAVSIVRAVFTGQDVCRYVFLCES